MRNGRKCRSMRLFVVEIRGIPLEALAEATMANFHALFARVPRDG